MYEKLTSWLHQMIRNQYLVFQVITRKKIVWGGDSQKLQLTTLGKNPFHNTGCWKKPCIIASLLWNTQSWWTLTSQWAQRKGCGRQSQQRITTGWSWHCWQTRVVTCCLPTMVLTSLGLSSAHHPEIRLFRVDQSVEAWGDVSARYSSLPSERSSSWRKASD